MHTFEDSLFIPDVMRGQTIDAEDAQAMVIQNTEGTVRISLTDARVKITAPLVDISGMANITGDLSVSGALNVQVSGSTVNLANHNHAGDGMGPPMNIT